MKKIGLYYRELFVGELTYNGVNFVYNSNVENEKIAKNDIGFIAYRLYNSENKVLDKLPKIFDACETELYKNEEIISDAKIVEKDNLFERMYKYARLPQVEYSYHLKVIE